MHDFTGSMCKWDGNALYRGGVEEHSSLGVQQYRADAEECSRAGVEYSSTGEGVWAH